MKTVVFYRREKTNVFKRIRSARISGLDIVVIQSRALLLCITVVMDFGTSFLLSFGS